MNFDDLRIPLQFRRTRSVPREMNRSWTSRTFSFLKPGCVRGSIFTLCSSTIGAGVLSLPYAVYDCGLVLGSLLLILGGVIFGLYYMVLVVSSERTRIFSYVGLMESLYGSGWKFFTEMSVILFSFGVLTAVQALLAELGMTMLSYLGFIADPTTFASRAVFLGLVNCFVLFPVCLRPELTSLRYLSIISVGSIVFLAALIFYQAPMYIAQNKTFASDLLLFKPSIHMVDTAALIFFAYDATINVPIVYTELSRRSHMRMRKVITRSMGLLIALFFIVGVFGYLSYLPNVPELVVFRHALEGEYREDYPMYVAIALITGALIVEVPTTLNPLRLSIQQLAGGSQFRYRPSLYYGATISVLFGSYCIALAIPHVIFYFKLLGGVCSVFNGFVFPSNR